MRDKVRLNSLSLPPAGDWLQMVSCPALGLQLKAAELRMGCLFRLGVEPLCSRVRVPVWPVGSLLMPWETITVGWGVHP